mgnify:CR=1 FL=1
MKIVGFESNNGVRLGVVDGDDVIDLQIADANLSSDLGRSSAPEQRRPQAARRTGEKCSSPPRADRWPG